MSVTWVIACSKSLTSNIFFYKRVVNFLRDSLASCLIWGRLCELFKDFRVLANSERKILLNLMNKVITPIDNHKNYLEVDSLKVVKNNQYLILSFKSIREVVEWKYATWSIGLEQPLYDSKWRILNLCGGQAYMNILDKALVKVVLIYSSWTLFSLLILDDSSLVLIFLPYMLLSKMKVDLKDLHFP